MERRADGDTNTYRAQANRYLNRGERLAHYLAETRHSRSYKNIYRVSPELIDAFSLQGITVDTYAGLEILAAARAIEKSGCKDAILGDDEKRFFIANAFYEAKKAATEEDIDAALEYLDRIYDLIERVKSESVRQLAPKISAADLLRTLSDPAGLNRKREEFKQVIETNFRSFDEEGANALARSSESWKEAYSAQAAEIIVAAEELTTLKEQYERPRGMVAGAQRGSALDEARELTGEVLRVGLHDLAEASAAVGDPSFNGKMEDYQTTKALAVGLLDMTTALTPGVSLGRDVYEALIGKNLITQEDLTIGERAIAAISASTLGVGSVVKGTLKALGKIGGFLRISRKMEIGEHSLREALQLGEEILGSAIVKERFGPISAGPLHNIPLRGSTGAVADTFRSASYFEVVLSEPTKFYRVYGGSAEKLASPYWSRIRPTRPLQATIDCALDPAWGNNATRWVEIMVPANTRIYEGVASQVALRASNPQMKVGQLLGGGHQAYITERVSERWIQQEGVF